MQLNVHEYDGCSIPHSVPVVIKFRNHRPYDRASVTMAPDHASSSRMP